MIGVRLGGLLAALVLVVSGGPALAQPAPTESGYRLPPEPIVSILDADPTPGVGLSRDRRTMVILERESLPPIAAVSEPILRLAGYRINPRTNGPIEARTAWLKGLSFQDVQTGRTVRARLPQGARFYDGRFSPDGKRFSLVIAREDGLELWIVDAATGEARRLAGRLNAAWGSSYSWLPDSSGVLARLIPEGRGAAPTGPTAPTGPIVQENAGRAAPVRTFADLLTNSHEEALFEHYFTVQLTRIGLDGQTATLGAPGLWTGFQVSPDGRFILLSRIKRPFSYVVPAGRFPTEVTIADWSGKTLRTLVDRPLADDIPPPFDAVVKGPRSPSWRDDAPATLVWVEAQDGGDPRTKVEIHDTVFMQDAPFTGEPVRLVDLKQRYGGIAWGRDDFALVYSRWWDTRNETRIAIDPSRPGGQGRVLLSRNYQSQYDDPGSPAFKPLPDGGSVLHFTPDGKGLFVTGMGPRKEGDFPFVGVMSLADGKLTKTWEAGASHYEPVIALLDDSGRRFITQRQSRTDPPNYFLRDLNRRGAAGLKALTAFKDPAPQFAGVTKQQITYKRADGVQLSATLYLPAGYDPKRDGPLPMLMWAYPDEFTDRSVAAQTVDRSNRFTRPGGSSHLFLLTQGYAVLDNPSMPIIGDKGAEANDTYIEQLVANAEAAVDAVVAMGVADRDRIAVGGHSYGAFMTANLLAHTDLFRAGIARSGAYNRTLTPFGFQAEQRTYWQAVDTYTKMSPFTYAPQIKEPILLIHGEADDNSGTFPVQSERFYAALKGAGATVRYVVLPAEAHGYRARESNLHTLWEMVAWMDRHVKNAPPKAKTAAD
jgi:dipeptidyl aminopeptidase/acylaminoacyl peptidase